MSSRIGECIGAFLVQVSAPTNYWKQPTPLPAKKKEDADDNVGFKEQFSV
jgi:hypothetical protein